VLYLGEFCRDYIASWLGPILEFTFLQQYCVHSWILVHYGIMRQEDEGVPELDWLQMFLAFAYLVEYEDHQRSRTRIRRITW
jgi:hypothetical protein